MGSLQILENQIRRLPLQYIILKELSSYLNKYSTSLFINKIVQELDEGTLSDILRRRYFSKEFLEKLLQYDEDDSLWYLLNNFMEPVYHNFIRFHLLDFLGTFKSVLF